MEEDYIQVGLSCVNNFFPLIFYLSFLFLLIKSIIGVEYVSFHTEIDNNTTKMLRRCVMDDI